MNGISRPAIYPRYCFHLAPTNNVWCLLRVADIQCLQQHPGFEGQDFYFYKNLPIRWVRVVGLVVAIDEFAGRRVFTIDDSSGYCIEAITTYTPRPKKEPAVNVNHDAATNERAHSEQHATGHTLLVEEKKDDPVLPYDHIDVGSVVDIKAKLTTFREELQLKIEKMVSLASTAQEVALWKRRADFRRDILEKPWILQEKDIRKCRKEGERTEEAAERKQRYVKAAVERAALRHSKREDT